MVRKVYTYPGKSYAIVPVPCGRARINIEFRDGCLDKKQARPATYATGDPVMQAIIENSPMFGHLIFLRDIYEIPGTPAVKPVAKPAPAAPVEPAEEKVEEEVTITPTEYPDVTTFEAAVAVLKAIPGVKVQSLRTPASAKKIAAMNAVVFPNYNFE